MKSKQTGFTLIELVIVIVILGILAASALPRFLDLTEEAREAAVKGLAGGVQSASSVARAACILDSTCTTSGSSSVSVEGSTVAMLDGYPSSGTGGIREAMDFQAGDFTYTPSTGRFTFTTATLPNCHVEYVPANGATGANVNISLTCS